MNHLSTTLLVACLILVPLAAIAEHGNLKVWGERLIRASLEDEPDRHTPRYVDGTILPPTITNNLVLTREDNPILVTGTTTIAPGASLTLQADSIVYAHEFAQLQVAGTLTLNGTPVQPIAFASNELHPDNQAWNGIIVNKGGRASATHVSIHHATPAVTCEEGSSATFTSAEIHASTLAAFTASSNCSIVKSTIYSTRDGITAMNTDPIITGTRFFVARHPIRYVRPL